MPRGGCLSAAATHRTPTRRDSRGRSIWSWSVSSTTPTLALDAAASPSRFRSDRRASEAVPVTLLRVASASVLPRAGPTGLHRTGVGQSTDSIGRPTSIRSWLDPPFLVSRVHGSPAAAAVAGLPQPSPKGQQSGSHGGRCRCPALLVPCPSANVPGGRNQAAPAETLLPGLHRLPP
jgi:hypothetical protein